MTLNTTNSHDYRTWPVFLISFIRTFYVSIFERALFNYLYLIIGIRTSTLGFISSASALTYIIAPIVGQFLTNKYLGVRRALLLNAVLTPVLTGFQIFYPEAWFLILCRIIMGLAMGLYWPNILNFLSKWQNISTPEKTKKNFASFNFSWNFGFISGLLIGVSWAIFLGDYLGMIISWLISFLLIPVSLFLEKDEDLEESKEKIIYQTEDPLSQFDIKEDLVINSQTPMIIYPIFYSWLSIMFLATSKSIFIFGYPILLKSFFPTNTPTYPTYLVQCGVQLAQLGGLTWINYTGTYKRKLASLIAVGMIGLIAFTIILIENIWYISIITTIAGLFIGLLHGVGMKIMLEYGAAENTSKYSMINEIIIGIGFGLTPIISGFVVEIQIFAIHGFIVFFGIFALIGLLYISRNIKNNNEK